MKNYLITVLENTGYSYMIDESSQIITVFEKSKVQLTENEIVAKKVDSILGELMRFPAFLEFCRLYPGMVCYNHGMVKLNTTQKLVVVYEFLKWFMPRYMKNVERLTCDYRTNSAMLDLNEHLLDIVSILYNALKENEMQ